MESAFKTEKAYCFKVQQSYIIFINDIDMEEKYQVKLQLLP